MAAARYLPESSALHYDHCQRNILERPARRDRVCKHLADGFDSCFHALVLDFFLPAPAGLSGVSGCVGGVLLATPATVWTFLSPEGRTENSPGLKAWAVLFSPFGRLKHPQKNVQTPGGVAYNPPRERGSCKSSTPAAIFIRPALSKFAACSSILIGGNWKISAKI